MTLRDVAERAGVSPKTVSRVVNEDPAVSEDTRAAVLAVIRALNYVPDHAARMMRTATSDLVGLMTDVIATTPTTIDLVRGAQSALREAGRTMLIANTEGDRELERVFWRRFRGHKAAGVIYATMYHRPLDFGSPDFERPIVLANCFSIRGDRTAVVPDDEKGGYVQAAHLLALGHRRIGIITLNPVIRATALRGAGHRTAFVEAGVPFDMTLEVPGFVGPVEGEALVGYEAALRLLDRPDRPTAIICGNDKIAIQVFSAAAARGLAVPDDLSVMGYDDMTVISEVLRPRLTTVALPYFDIGRIAVQALIASEDHPAAAPRGPIHVVCPLIERESCRRIG